MRETETGRQLTFAYCKLSSFILCSLWMHMFGFSWVWLGFSNGRTWGLNIRKAHNIFHSPSRSPPGLSPQNLYATIRSLLKPPISLSWWIVILLWSPGNLRSGIKPGPSPWLMQVDLLSQQCESRVTLYATAAQLLAQNRWSLMMKNCGITDWTNQLIDPNALSASLPKVALVGQGSIMIKGPHNSKRRNQSKCWQRSKELGKRCHLCLSVLTSKMKTAIMNNVMLSGNNLE